MDSGTLFPTLEDRAGNVEWLATVRLVSRPGTFSYGRFDNGARALAETMQVRPGHQVLDLGCGCGTNDIFAAQQAGADRRTTFVDSNVRAVALADEDVEAMMHRGYTMFVSKI